MIVPIGVGAKHAALLINASSRSNPSGDGLLSSSLRTVVTVGGDPFDCDAFLLLLEDRAPRRRLLRVEVRVGVVVAVAVNVVVRRAIFEPIVTHFFPLIR